MFANQGNSGGGPAMGVPMGRTNTPMQLPGGVPRLLPQQQRAGGAFQPVAPMEEFQFHQAPPPHQIDPNKQVEDALAILQYEANFSDQTMQVLRQAVAQGRAQTGSNRPPLQIHLNSPGMIPRYGQRSVKPASSKRQQLTVEEAAEIYAMRPRAGGDNKKGSMIHCRVIAPKYGVTPKTIRDVWSGRTWAEATRHLWTEDEIAQRKERDKGDKPKGTGNSEDDNNEAGDVDFHDSIQPSVDGGFEGGPVHDVNQSGMMNAASGNQMPDSAAQPSMGVDNMQEQLLRYQLNIQMASSVGQPQQQTKQHQFGHQQPPPQQPQAQAGAQAQAQPQAHHQPHAQHSGQVAMQPQTPTMMLSMSTTPLVFGNLSGSAPLEQNAPQFQHQQQLILQDQIRRFNTTNQGRSQ